MLPAAQLNSDQLSKKELESVRGPAVAGEKWKHDNTTTALSPDAAVREKCRALAYASAIDPVFCLCSVSSISMACTC